MASKPLLAFYLLLLSITTLNAQAAMPETLLQRAYARMYDSIDLAIGLGTEALALSRRHAIVEQELSSHIFLTEAYYRSQAFENSRRHADQAIQLAVARRSYEALSDAYFYKANCLFEETKIQEGLALLPRAYEAAVKAAVGPRKRILLLSGIGYWSGQAGEFDTAFEKLQEALQIAQADSLVRFRGYLLTLLSTTSMLKGDYSRALHFETRSLMVSDSLGDAERVAISRHNLSDIYLHMGDYAKALEEAKEIERNKKLVNDVRLDAGFQGRMGLIYFQMKDYVLSRSYFERALSLYKERSDRGGQAIVISDMTPLLIQQEAYELARARLSTILAEMQAVKDTVLSFRCQNALAKLWDAQGRHALAQKAYLDCIPFYQRKQIWSQLAETYLHLAQSYHKAGDLEKALQYSDLALVQCEKAHMNIRKAEVLKLQYELYKTLGDLDMALERHEAYFDYTDSIRTEVAQRRLMEERVNKNVQDLEAEKEVIALRNSVLANQNRLFQLTALFLVLGLAGFYWFYWRLRKARNRLEQQKEELENLNSTKDRFFGIIAHDLRSPIIALQGVGMQMDYFLEKNNPQQLRSIASSVDNTAKRLNGLLDNLLAWALSQTGRFPYHPERTQAADLVYSVVEVFELVATVKQVEISCQLPDNLYLLADEHALRTILRNLLGNALKFTEPGGHVTLSASEQSGWARFSVQDTGVGMTAEQLRQLFDLKGHSQQGTRGEKGSGLGLVLCKELVELHQGQIYGESILGQGTTIFFTLPLSTTESPEPALTME
ncbi:MAG: hypothetical protein KDC44_01175 [Phaeodactylibacter sp.]|nr:hypothetical protein [Phaeodactylibacter sp.]